MLYHIFVPTDYKFALERYRDCKRKYEKTLNTLTLTYQAITTSLIHGKKEASLIVKIKDINGLLFNDMLDLVRAERNLNKIARKKEGYYD